jgi:Lysine-specific metallo-endopeptidase
MANDRFGKEYAAQKKQLETGTLAGVCSGLLDLKKVLGADGPDRAYAGLLDTLRNVSLKFKEPDKIMEAAGLDPAATGIPSDAGVRNAGLLKFLRHLYLVGARGSQQVWVLDTPLAFAKFPQEVLLDANLSHALVKTTLTDVREKFGSDTRKRLGECMQQGLAWVESAKRVLASASSDAKAMEKVKRWFADGATSAGTLTATISTLQAGFKKMAASMNGNLIVVTDMPHDRGDPANELTEAYMLSIGVNAESPRTIYIEQALFENYDVSVLHDMKKNWTRVLVHEVAHIDGRVDDHRYAFLGIGVGTNLSDAQAVDNADSWAFFAADCAGALTHGEILRATGGSGGNLNKLAKNWN